MWKLADIRIVNDGTSLDIAPSSFFVTLSSQKICQLTSQRFSIASLIILRRLLLNFATKIRYNI